MTSALVTPGMKTSDNNINTNFYNILMDKLNSMGGQITYPDGNIGWFNPELMKIALDLLRLNRSIADIAISVSVSVLAKYMLRRLLFLSAREKREADGQHR
jgi:hypothetical protein